MLYLSFFDKIIRDRIRDLISHTGLKFHRRLKIKQNLLLESYFEKKF